MVKIIALLIVSYLLFVDVTPSHAVKAIAVVTGASAGSVNSLTSVQVSVTDDAGSIYILTSFSVNFSSSTNQMNADIKARVRDVLAGYGVVLTVNDIVLFGGAQ